jgi:hypothetical protein
MGRQVTEYHVRAAQDEVILGLGRLVGVRHTVAESLPLDAIELAGWDDRYERSLGEAKVGAYVVTATDPAGWTTVVADIAARCQSGHPLAVDLSGFVRDTVLYGWHNTTTYHWRCVVADRGESLGEYARVARPPCTPDLWDVFAEHDRTFGGHGFSFSLLAHVHGPGAILILAANDPPPYWPA